jgi:hypothetical protein
LASINLVGVALNIKESFAGVNPIDFYVFLAQNYSMSQRIGFVFTNIGIQ